MPSLVIPDTVQATIRWDRTSGRSAYNVLHFKTNDTSLIGPSQATAWANQVTAAFNTAGTPDFLTSIANEWKIGLVSLRDLRTANLPAVEVSLNLVGTSTGDPLPNNVAFCVTLRTALAGRSYRGRVYIPGWSEGASDGNGQPSSAIAAQAVAFVNALNGWSVGGGAPYTMAVASRTKLESNNVTTVVARDLVWDTQRRRARPLS